MVAIQLLCIDVLTKLISCRSFYRAKVPGGKVMGAFSFKLKNCSNGGYEKSLCHGLIISGE